MINLYFFIVQIFGLVVLIYAFYMMYKYGKRKQKEDEERQELIDEVMRIKEILDDDEQEEDALCHW